MNDDTISRQAAIDAVNDLPNCDNGYSDTYDKSCIIGVLEELPSVQPEQKKGQWRNIQIGEWLGVECTACKIAHDWREVPHVNGGGVAWYFCPECGADMRGEGNG